MGKRKGNDIDRLLEEVQKGIEKTEPRSRANMIILYLCGASEKLSQARFALKMMSFFYIYKNDYIDPADDVKIEKKIYFCIDSFFIFLYSCFDILAQAVNQKYQLGLTEREVNLKKVSSELQRKNYNNKLSRHLQDLQKTRFFKSMEKYRHCAVHRRQIYILEEVRRGTKGYNYSSTGPGETITRYICDDPLVLKPQIKKKRELKIFCEKMIEDAEKHIRKIAELI